MDPARQAQRRLVLAPLGVTLAGVALTLLAAGAWATPLVAVDLDPATPGVQAVGSVALGGSLVVEISVSGIDPGAPLNGFELDLFVSPGAALTGALLGSFLVPPVLAVEEVFAADRAGLAAVTLGPGAVFGSGVLAQLTLSGVSPGMSLLSLQDVILSQPFGVAIPGVVLQDATVTVIPEPATGALLGLGLAFCAAAWRAGRPA